MRKLAYPSSTCWLGIFALAILIGTVSAVAEIDVLEPGEDLQNAVNTAIPGDIIIVPPGVYSRVDINKRLTLIGEGAQIRAGPQEACMKVTADQVNITGFTVRDGLYGILLKEVKGCNVSQNEVVFCKQPGIALLFSDHNLIQGNNASFNGLGGEGWYGIYLSNSDDNLLLDNVAVNNGAYGIDLFPSCSNNTIRGNILSRNMYGLYMFTDCFGNIIEHNVMNENTASGLDLRFNCTGNRIANNTMNQNVVVGISLLDSPDNRILNNEIHDNQRFGLQLQGGSGSNLVAGNEISGSSTGIYVEAAQNVFYANVLLDNVIQVQERANNSWDGGYPQGGNSWGDYRGSDQFSGPSQDIPGADGIGDIPYNLSDKVRDRYPIMGTRYEPIKVTGISTEPAVATVGDNLIVTVQLESVNGISQATVRVPEAKATGYVRLTPSGQSYQGSLVTALMEPGQYTLILEATDRRGYELEENIGGFKLNPRQGRDFESAMSQLRG